MLDTELDGVTVHMTGIKGSGMVALAQILHERGARIRGTDTAERFYTDEILEGLGIEVIEAFDAANILPETQLLVYSSAYNPDTHPELTAARERSIPRYTYTEALGRLSERCDATAIAGVHGKSTSTALAGVLARAIGIPATVVVGSMVPDFGNRAASVEGDRHFIAETCEYRRNFLSFHPDRIMVTGIEADHLDYFRDYNDIFAAFVEYAERLSTGGTLIYCCDDEGARELASRIAVTRPDIHRVAYGFHASGRYAVTGCETVEGSLRFTLSGFDRVFSLRVPGHHNAVNAAGVLAVIEHILRIDGERSLTGSVLESVVTALSSFRGLKRRSEVVGTVDDILVLDDYAHHPSAIEAELTALREFYPGRRLVVDFMSHTYSRTAALLEDFAEALSGVDALFLHRIYASARESYDGSITGRSLEEAVRRRGTVERVVYVEDPLQARELVIDELKPGDIFLTMGAGDNWQLGRAVLTALTEGGARVV